MHNEGFSTMCGHGVIAVTTIVIERNLIALPLESDGSMRLVLDSPAGPIHATAVLDVGLAAAADSLRVNTVRFRNVPSFVLHAAVPVRAGTREVRVDVAFGGAFYAIVDSESVGIPIVQERLSDLRRAGMGGPTPTPYGVVRAGVIGRMRGGA